MNGTMICVVCVRTVVSIVDVVIMASCRLGRNVYLDNETRRPGNDMSARSMCLVCCATWLKIL